MKATMKKTDDFKPFELNLKVETIQEAGLLLLVFKTCNLENILKQGKDVDFPCQPDFFYNDRCNIAEILSENMGLKHE